MIPAMIWKFVPQHSYLKIDPSRKGLLRAPRLAISLLFAFFFLCAFYSSAAAQIVLDGMITEPDWHQLGTSAGGPTPSFGAGHEINALYAEIDATNFYIGVAGNVQFGNRILIFIDSIPGGFTNSNFGRAAAPPGISTFNPTSGTSFTQFDDNFTPNYVLSISTNNGQANYFWDLYTLSGSLGSGGGPNLFLGDRNDPDLRANPANADQTRGFESRLTYSSSGAGVDIAINQSRVRMMAMYINDAGTLSNQFISRAGPGETVNFGNGQILFNSATPNPVAFAHMLVVNELDYIQPGPNVAEFIELKNITNLPISIDSYRLRFARGVNSPPEIYREIDLPNVIVNPGAYFVICTNPANVPNCNFTVEPPMDLLENSIPAAVALAEGNLLVDVVSYGGNVGAPYSEGAGVVPADDGTQVALGISRIVDGMDTNRNNIDFALRCVTPGQANSAQTGGCGPQTPTFTPTMSPTPTGTSQTPTPTGTATPTSTPSPTGSVTPTATGSTTPAPPSGCSNILVNGDFEGAHGWEFGGSPIPGKYTSIPVHGGVRAVQLGNPPDSGNPLVYSYSSIRQGVSVPHGSTIQLRFWHNYGTTLPTLDSTNNTQDRQEVILLKPNGDTLHIVQRVRRNDNSWQQTVLDLTQFAGRSFVLYFNVINYGSGGRTWTYLDDVELLVCPPGGGTLPTVPPGVTATPTPTFSPTPTFTPTPTFSPTPTGSPPVTPSGNSIEQDGYGLTALAVENPSTRYSNIETPQPGQKLVAVQVIVRNINNSSFTSAYGFANLVDTNGFVYPSSLVSADGRLPSLTVNPGEAAQGWVGFIVPQASTPATLRYQFFGTGATLQVGLAGLTASAAAVQFSAETSNLTGETPTPTVTPTNTAAPSPSVSPSATISPTVTTVSFAPSAPENNLALDQARVVALQVLPTPTIAFVADRVIVPEGCVELIDNGSFEARGMGWSQEGGKILPQYGAPTLLTGDTTQSGLAIRLGLVEDEAVAGISATQQLVQLPKESNKITLTFRYFPLYNEPSSRGDFQYVDIYHGESGQFVGRALGVQQNERKWIAREYDLSAFAGEAVRLFFMVSNDGIGGSIAMYIDDVSIMACRVPKSQSPNSLAAIAQAQRTLAGTSTPQPLVSSISVAPNAPEEIAPAQGFSFGRMGGLLAVLGIAGAMLVLLPLTRRFTK